MTLTWGPVGGQQGETQVDMLKYVLLSGQSRERDKLRFISPLLLI